MKAFSSKLWIAPVFGSLFFWGVSMIAAPGGETMAGQRLSLIAAAQTGQIKAQLSQSKSEGATTVRGRVSKYKEGETLIVDDGSDKINVEWKNKFRSLHLKVGDLVTIRGTLNGDQLIAEQINNGDTQVYPQKDNDIRLNDKDAKTRYDDSASAATTTPADFFIADIKNSKTGDMIEVEGVIVDLPEEELLILQDPTGEVFVEIDDARSFLNLRKGDKVKVEGKVSRGTSGQNEVQASRIEKK